MKCSIEYGLPGPIMTQAFPALAEHYKNPYGRWWSLKQGARKPDGFTPSARPWGEPMPRNGPIKSPEDLPTARYFDGLGMVVMRSDWTEDATYIGFKCGPSFWSHSHLDSGHFSIFKRGALAIDSGSYRSGTGNEHYEQYYVLSLAHNVVTVTDPDETPMATRKRSIVNDGGQRWTAGHYGTSVPYSVPDWQKRSEEFDTGSIVAFQAEKEFTYVCGDMTKAYTNSRSGTGHKQSRSKRVRKLMRSLLYLRPDHLIVFDQVESFDKSFKKRWLLHTVNEPRVEKDLIVAERADLIYRRSARDKRMKYAISATPNHPFFKQHSDCEYRKGSQPQLYQYDGEMFLQRLLPEQAETVKVGGPGKEFWDGTANRIQGSRGKLPVRSYTHESDAGRWRVEVSPKLPAKNDLFLHVIQVGLKSKKTPQTSSKLIQTSGGTGLEVDLGRGRKATLTFKKGVGGHIRIEGGGRSKVDMDLAEKVLPNVKIEK